MTRGAASSLVLVLVLGFEVPANGEEVTCTVKETFTCADPGAYAPTLGPREFPGGCVKDENKSLVVVFTIDRSSGTVSDNYGSVYKLVPVRNVPLPKMEYAVQAFGQVGNSATDTVVIGQRSFVSSNVSVSPPRAHVQLGTCKGLVAQ
jgi:hypothetical protein